MKKAILVLSVLGVMILQSGCATSPGSSLMAPKGNEEKMVTTGSQFDELASHSSNYVGQEKLLAGAIVSIDQTDEGYLVLAQWLPYPATQAEQGPQASESSGNRHFLIRFVGKREREFYTVRGNKFLLEGKVEGTKKALVNLFGSKKELLAVNAKCVHIWETGEANVSSSAASEYSPTRKRTVCAD